MNRLSLPSLVSLSLLAAVVAAPHTSAFYTAAEAFSSGCGVTDTQNNSGIDEVLNSATTAASGVCEDGNVATAAAATTADVALASISLDAQGTGFYELNVAFTNVQLFERLTLVGVPDGVDEVDLHITIEFEATAPGAAFYNTASMDGWVNAQFVSGEVRLSGCSGDQCTADTLPVRTETLTTIITVPRLGGGFGNIDVGLVARANISSTQMTVRGSMSVTAPDLPGGALVSQSGVFGSGAADADGDDIDDTSDNCTLIPNTAQRDTDADGYGNLCDADFDNNCVVNAIDLGYFRTQFFGNDPDADLNGDGVVNTIDLGIFRTLFFGAPGPSGQTSACP
ncbi:MAG: hypothetical protein AB8G16_03635 [Gammaproteobacteria bacterium]